MDSVIITLVDVVLVLLLIWRIKPSRFRELKWTLVGTAAVSWSIFGFFLVWVFWGTYYQFFFPGWFRYGGILIFVPVLYGLFALAFYWLALRVPGNPILIFCLLAGLEAVLEHLWGIYGLKILEIPFLKGVSMASILAFSFPEYIFYWCIIIGIAFLFQTVWRFWINWQRTKAGVV